MRTAGDAVRIVVGDTAIEPFAERLHVKQALLIQKHEYTKRFNSIGHMGAAR